MRVLYCGTGWLPMVELIRQRLPGHEITFRDAQRPLEEQVEGIDVLIPSNFPLHRSVIEAAPRLRLIQQSAAGYEGIDLDAARERGVPVCNAPGKNPEAVAEAALMLILALARRLPEVPQFVEDRRIGEPVGVELHGSTLGIVGLGRAGSHLAHVAEALGMSVRGVRSSSSAREMDELLAESDFVSLHCPLTASTRGLIGREALSKMKRGAFLINCARGHIVDRGAMEEALDSGQLGGVGLDVHWDEPVDPGDPLCARANVIVLSHLGGSTASALGRLADVVAENIRRVGRGQGPVHRVR